MEVFLAVAVIAVVALLATSARLYRLRRTPTMSLLMSGGWLAVAVGVALGPQGSNLIEAKTILSTTPLLVMCLGWVGLMVGLQARRDMLARVPRGVGATILMDLVVTTITVGAISAIGARIWLGADRPWAELIEPIAVLVAASLGWAMETRSLSVSWTPAGQRLAMLIRVTGGLAAIGALLVFGIAEKMIWRAGDGVVVFDAWHAVVGLTMTVALAGLAGVLGRYTIGRAGSTPGDQLAVFLGLMALIAGVAAQLGFSPLLAAMITGVVVANVSTVDLLRFERFIVKAEHIVAMLIFMLTGLLLRLDIGWPEVGMALAIALCRWAVKPAIFAWGVRQVEAGAANSEQAPPAPLTDSRRFAPIRQSAVSAPIALGLVLLEPSDFHMRLLSVVVLAGLLSVLFTVAQVRISKRWKRSPSAGERSDHR